MVGAHGDICMQNQAGQINCVGRSGRLLATSPAAQQDRILPGSALEGRLRRTGRGACSMPSRAAAMPPMRRSTRSCRVGVVVPRSMPRRCGRLRSRRDEGAPSLARGGGTSQCGQTVKARARRRYDQTSQSASSRSMPEPRPAWSSPGMVLDDLNRQLKPHGLWFPVEVSTASRATIGGMAGNNSCGGALASATARCATISLRSTRLLADGTRPAFRRGAARPRAASMRRSGARADSRHARARRREARRNRARFPKVQRRVGGYNLDALLPRTRRTIWRTCWSAPRARWRSPPQST